MVAGLVGRRLERRNRAASIIQTAWRRFNTARKLHDAIQRALSKQLRGTATATGTRSHHTHPSSVAATRTRASEGGGLRRLQKASRHVASTQRLRKRGAPQSRTAMVTVKRKVKLWLPFARGRVRNQSAATIQVRSRVCGCVAVAVCTCVVCSTTSLDGVMCIAARVPWTSRQTRSTRTSNDSLQPPSCRSKTSVPSQAARCRYRDPIGVQGTHDTSAIRRF